MEPKIMGVDPSMRSTGIVVKIGGGYKYHLICSQATKKVQRFSHPDFELHLYEPDAVKGKNAIGQEGAKTTNVSRVVGEFNKLLERYEPDWVVIEAIAMHGSGRLDELSGLNYSMRLACVARNIPVYAVSATSNKLAFAGNGQATKEMMVAGWKACEPLSDIYGEALGKHVEDLADAYALIHYPIYEPTY